MTYHKWLGFQLSPNGSCLWYWLYDAARVSTCQSWSPELATSVSKHMYHYLVPWFVVMVINNDIQLNMVWKKKEATNIRGSWGHVDVDVRVHQDGTRLGPPGRSMASWKSARFLTCHGDVLQLVIPGWRNIHSKNGENYRWWLGVPPWLDGNLQS